MMMEAPYKDLPFLIVEEIEKPKKKVINELSLSSVGKLFLAGLAAWVAGRASNLKIRGTRQEVDAIAGALRSSRRFQDELKQSGATVQSVMQKLKLKNARGREFERILGVPWPL